MQKHRSADTDSELGSQRGFFYIVTLYTDVESFVLHPESILFVDRYEWQPITMVYLKTRQYFMLRFKYIDTIFFLDDTYKGKLSVYQHLVSEM